MLPLKLMAPGHPIFCVFITPPEKVKSPATFNVPIDTLSFSFMINVPLKMVTSPATDSVELAGPVVIVKLPLFSAKFPATSTVQEPLPLFILKEPLLSIKILPFTVIV